MISRFSVRLKQTILFIHRWMGVCFCVLFLLWFCSDMVLMYWDYPMVSARDRLEREALLGPFTMLADLPFSAVAYAMAWKYPSLANS